MTPLPVAITVEQCWQPVPGGSGTYVSRLSRALADLPGIEVTGITARHGGAAPDADFAPTVDRLVSSALPRPLLYESWNVLGRPSAERLAGSGIAVVHATTWAVPPTRRPLVVTVHDLAFVASPEMFTRRGVRFFHRSLERVRAEADRVIVPSQMTLVDCVAAGIPEARIRVVPHGVDMPAVTGDQVADFRRSRDLTRPYVLWCGTLEPRKNVTGVVGAYSRMRRTLPGYDLVLVGPRGWGDQVAARTADGDSVHWLGRLSQHDLACAYADSAAFCYPSFAEGFGLPVLEAMTYGVPVVTSVRTPMVELVGDAGIAVEPSDEDALAEALVSVLEARPQRSEAAARRARAFRWETAAAATSEVYSELA